MPRNLATPPPPNQVRPESGLVVGFRAARWLKRIGILALLLGAMLVGLLQIRAPHPDGPDAPPNEFSAARAMEKLSIIAKEPHPVGSAAHDRVRAELLAELEDLGLKPEVQRAEAQRVVVEQPKAKRPEDPSNGDPGLPVVVENIVARIPGLDNSKALMIAAHYDSVPGGPGAADDGASIAAMLETVRAIQASGPLQNDLLLLMTDGEELGLLGAEAFMREHPWAKDVGLVLNFEARGNKGPSFLFETSERNGWLIREFMKAAKQPLAYSLIYNFYKLMPNDTDLTVFREGGLPGLNFAFGVGLDAYHTALDTPDNLDRSSLQHQGDYMLSLARHFGQLDLSDVEQEDRIYFNAFGWSMISYPESWALGFTVLIVLLFAVTVWHGTYRHRLSLKGMAGGFLVSLLHMAAVLGVVAFAWMILRASVPRPYYISIMKDLGVGTYYLIGLLLLVLLITTVLIRRCSRYVRTENLWIGALLLWVLLCAATTLYLPGGSYLFAWPLLFSLTGLNVSYVLRKGAWIWASALSAMPGILLFAPILYLAFVLMTLDMAGALMTVAALVCTLIYPLFCRVPKQGQDDRTI
ncbi:M20/M25/M40 family metallo-hydrolase [Cohnella nanjingensis]|uniref:Vacuolar membrane protease n=1 Tax=Cohnella nanjingensis TaxID=1387779 RepID=A0A7X0RR28_9BACL|nr:M20/M25/M40 family metallo-hydrolase [Cohnella nanjingensis]MBB6671923.1 M20/M25/M40 family metallo-hydrolase [Cohnella nanjingensis]